MHLQIYYRNNRKFIIEIHVLYIILFFTTISDHCDAVLVFTNFFLILVLLFRNIFQ